jgi:hypothetical protein
LRPAGQAASYQATGPTPTTPTPIRQSSHNLQPAKSYSARNSHQKLLVQCFLKMDAWRPKHLEDQDTIKWLWKCIKLVILLWYSEHIGHESRIPHRNTKRLFQAVHP